MQGLEEWMLFIFMLVLFTVPLSAVVFALVYSLVAHRLGWKALLTAEGQEGYPVATPVGHEAQNMSQSQRESTERFQTPIQS